ncbi:MAG: ATP-dependent Clp protease ATP-binding subunit [Alphaproteobacteria bacterium]|nr:ATP-dependent Clp protease ATP-binding subunit [Alphaproteobacteria bacterium]
MTKQWDYLVPDEKFNELVRLYCNNYTALDKEGRYDPITGRDKEIDDAVLILLQRGRKNVCFLAGAGVGKSAVVVGLAQKINSDNVPELLKDARIIEIDLSRMSSGTASKSEFQGRFLPFMKGLAERYHNPDEHRYILFMDEIHQIMPDCPGSSYAGLSDTIKSYLTQGDIMLIGATTLDEYRMFIASDTALDRRFQKITLKEPNVPETYTIMKNLRAGLEKHHRVKLSNEDLMLIVQLTEQHMRKRNQPDKSIITTDAAMAYHVFCHGIDTEVSRESIYYMIARETGLNAKALHDETLIQKVTEDVATLEEATTDSEKTDGNSQPYDPSFNLKNIKMDNAFQAELAAEKAATERLLQKTQTGAQVQPTDTNEE